MRTSERVLTLLPCAQRVRHELVQRDRQIAHALAGCVIDGVGDRCRYADDTDLADALEPQRIAVVLLVARRSP